uniref:Uncharacterized protein n=1 Tax=Caenorhabditis japonica TaxID=281687 RepID=A0A8R1IU52_CAEJA
MLVKPVVQPEYDPADPRDFQPDPRYLFHDDRDFELRLKNARCKRDEIFVNFRPFWLMRTPDDVPPRSRMIEASEHLAHSRPTSPLLKDFPPPRRQKFFDPRTDELGKMMAIDASIGVNLNDAGKEKELARIRSNTIHAVVAVQTYRKSAEGKRRMVSGVAGFFCCC